jgi:3-oxoacyl-[acyl-carrier protein] reductase
VVSQQAAGGSAFDFSGAMVVVTGAASGLGLGMAQAFHAAGARVAMGDVREDAVESAAAKLGDNRVFAGRIDVRDETSVETFFAAAAQALGGPVTVAVANAGVVPNCPVLDMPVEEWDRTIETNLRGAFLTCRTAARSMVKSGHTGRIITIASGAYISGRIGASHYSASKAGIVMLTKVLAMELAARRITVNAIAPGYIKVRPDDPAPERSAFQEAMLANIPMGRQGSPADVAQAALFLASQAADYVTGEVLAVNGGAFAGRMYLPLN